MLSLALESLFSSIFWRLFAFGEQIFFLDGPVCWLRFFVFLHFWTSDSLVTNGIRGLGTMDMDMEMMHIALYV